MGKEGRIDSRGKRSRGRERRVQEGRRAGVHDSTTRASLKAWVGAVSVIGQESNRRENGKWEWSLEAGLSFSFKTVPAEEVSW